MSARTKYTPQSDLFRNIFLLVSAAYVVFAVGFAFQQPWATAIWPWKDS